MVNKALVFDVLANDHASATIKGISGSVDAHGKSWEKAGKAMLVAGTAIAAGLGVIIKTGLGETMEASQGLAQLQAGIKSTGNVAGVTVKGMESLATSIQGFSGQTDDSIVKTEQLLLTFKNIRNNGPDKIFDQATLAAANMAAKMGGDSSDSAIKLGKALQDPIKGMTALQKVGVVFTASQKEAITAMVEAGNTAGAQKIILSELTTEFGGAAKAAGESLPGQLEIAKRGFEDFSQSIVEKAAPALSGFFSTTQEGMRELQALPDPVKEGAVALAALTGAATLAGGGFLVLAPRIKETRAAAAVLATDMPRLAGAMKALGVAGGIATGVLAVAAIGFGIYASKQAEAKRKVDDYRESLDQATGALTENTRAVAFNRLEQDGMIGKAKALGLNLQDVVTAAIDPSSKAYKRLASEMAYAKLVSDDMAKSQPFTSEGDAAARKAGETFNFLYEVLGAVDSSGKDVKASQRALADEVAAGVGPTQDATGAIRDQTEALNDVVDAQREASGIALSERDAQRALEAAYDAASVSITENGLTLDITTGKGRANQSALDGVAKSGWDLVASMQANGATQVAVQGTMQTTRDRFLLLAQSLGMSTGEANALANQLNLIPANIRSDVQIQTDKAQADLEAWLARANGRRALIQTGYTAAGPGGSGARMAGGGLLSGPGTSTSDSIPLLGSAGEYMVKASSVAKYGVGYMDDLNAQRLAAGGPVNGVTIPIDLDTSGLNGLLAANVPSAGKGGGSAASLIAAGRLLQAMHFSVTEHPAFGGVTAGGHIAGSAHYAGRAIDINHGAGTSAAEQAALASIMPLLHAAGLSTMFMVKGHFNHAHAQYDNGGYLPPGLSTVYNGTGKPEPVLTSQQFAQMSAGQSSLPDTITLVDADGSLIGRMKVIANAAISSEASAVRARPRR